MRIDAAIFDYGFTLSSEYYFNIAHPRIPDWNRLVQECAFRNEDYEHRWIRGKAKLPELASLLSQRTGLPQEEILRCLRDGCRNLRENQAVIDFARKLKREEIPLGLVTGNFDVFTEIVVPSHGYTELFDVIVNSADCGETDKRILWPIAFKLLGNNIGYGNSLLIEDTENEVAWFKEAGGMAIRYSGDDEFVCVLKHFRFDGKALIRTVD